MNSLRPLKLKDIIGQSNVKKCVEILLQSRKNSVFPHCLFDSCGPGLGKTTFALAIANEIGAKIYLANGGNISKTKDILPYLIRLRRGDVLFIDEIHRMEKKVQEQLYTVMEDFRYDLSKGACSVNIEEFSLLGATTESGTLLRPLYDRFEHHFTLEYYSTEELCSIIKINSAKLGYKVDDNTIKRIASISKFTPRISNSLLKWCCDYASSINSYYIDCKIFEKAMTLKQIDENGLDSADKKYLKVLSSTKKPMGVNTISAMTGFSVNMIENNIEPYLLKIGKIERGKSGRSLR